MSSILAGGIGWLSDTAAIFWQNLNVSQYSVLQAVVDITLVAVLFYWMIMLIRGTRATNIMLGLFVLGLVFAVSRWLQLFALGWLLDRLLTVILVAIPIIFQQELRRGLEKLGRTKFFITQEAKEIDRIQSVVIEVCFELAQKKWGGLIVFRNEVNLQEYIDTGTAIDGRVSKELLLSIFNPTGAMHDGAVVIENNRLVAAGCTLPHSFKNYPKNFGTRHKSALSLSEVTDAKVLVISEERGTVSYVSSGDIEEEIRPDRAQTILHDFFSPKKIFNKKRKSHQDSHV